MPIVKLYYEAIIVEYLKCILILYNSVHMCTYIAYTLRRVTICKNELNSILL